MEHFDCRERLKIALRRAKITQAEVARRSGLSKITVQKAFNGDATRKTLSAIADVLGVELTWLLAEDDDALILPRLKVILAGHRHDAQNRLADMIESGTLRPKYPHRLAA